MRSRFIIALLVFAAGIRGAMTADLPLMPAPAHVEIHDGALPIDGNFRVGFCGKADPAVLLAAGRFVRQLERITGVPMVGGIAVKDHCDAALNIETKSAVAMPKLGEDESYQLEITSESAHLTAPTLTGVLRGFATFEQLVRPAKTGFVVPTVSIQDKPRFPWRGFMLDACRHWMPVEIVERNIEAMAAVKLNVFHWHLADDQGFRVESRLYPRLQQVGADGHFYTQEQVRHVVRFAAERGIRVVPEFEMPGHATALLLAYPAFGSGATPLGIERDWGVFRPVLDPTREETYRFLEGLIGEMAGLFPDPYFHIGGDEVLDTDWKENPKIRTFMRAHGLKSSAELHAHFNRRVAAILARHGKTVIGWDEVLAPDLPKNIVIQSWRGQESLAGAARQGYRGILSSGYYLDHGRPASFHYSVDPLGGDAKSLNSEESARILGGEACMWTEYTSVESVDSRIWPRLAAIAERLWSPADVNDNGSMYARMTMVSEKLAWTGVEHLAAQRPMLARIAGFGKDGDLLPLAEAVNALGHDDRSHSGKYNSLVPLNRLADAARMENDEVRRLSADAMIAGTDHAAADRLRKRLYVWRGVKIEQESGLTAELIPLAAMISKISDAGLQALDLVEHNQRPPEGWVEQQRLLVAEAGKPIVEVHIAAADVLSALLDTLGGAGADVPARPSAK